MENSDRNGLTDTTSSTEKVRHITGRSPERIAVIALGPTSMEWHRGNMTYERQFGDVDEVWTLNKGLRTMKSDIGFVMDDLVGEANRCPQYAQDLADVKVPIITSIVDHDVKQTFPNLNLYAYPLRHVLTHLGVRRLLAKGWTLEQMTNDRESVVREGDILGRYMHNSIPYILAYALFIGVKEILLFGADYTFPGQAAREDDRANAEYWVGVCRAFGMNVEVPSNTTLLNVCLQRGFYGFGARQPLMAVPWVADIEREYEFVCRS